MAPDMEKIVALNKKQAELAIRVFQIGFDAWEGLVRLNLEAGRSLLQEGLANVGTLPDVQDLAGLTTWAQGQVQSGAEKVSGYSRNVYEIAGKATGDLGELLERTLLSNGQETLDWVEEALKTSSIPQPEATAAAAKAAMAHTQSVIEGISKAVRQTAGYADASVRAAATATAEAVKGSAK